MPRLALLLALAALTAPAASAQRPAPALPDTTVRLGVRPILAGFYTPTKGLGVGLGATVRNAVHPGTRLDVTAETMMRFGRYTARIATADPFHARAFLAAGASYEGSSVHRFYGLGPTSRRADAVRLRLRRAELEVRGGAYVPGARHVLVQPVVRLRYALARDVAEERPGALAHLDDASRAHLLAAEGRSSLGVSYGLELIADGLDRPLLPRAGSLVQLTARRYDGLDADAFRYVAATAAAYGFVPLGGAVLEGRLLAAVTRELGDRPVPFHTLPWLDGEVLGGYPPARFVGRDVLALSAGVRFPVLDVLNWIGAEGSVTVHAANAYGDLFRELAPGLTLRRAPEPVDGRTPLRPALALGGYVVDLARGRPVVSGQIGLSPEGVETAGLTFVFDLRAPRAPLR